MRSRACCIAAMHIVVVGCGRVGSGLAIDLAEAGHSVAIIDRDPSALARRLPEGFSGTAIEGSGFDRDVLDDAGISEADALVAVTSGDNTNILAARIARETYDVENVVARIYDPRRAMLYQRLGIPTVATVSWTIDQVMRKLLPESTAPEWVDPAGSLQLVQRPVTTPWAGKRVAQLNDQGDFRVVAVNRDAASILATDDLIMQEDDVLFLMVARAAETELNDVLHAGAPA